MYAEKYQASGQQPLQNASDCPDYKQKAESRAFSKSVEAPKDGDDRLRCGENDAQKASTAIDRKDTALHSRRSETLGSQQKANTEAADLLVASKEHSDSHLFRKLHLDIISLQTKLADNRQASGAERKLALLESITQCLNSYHKGEIPIRFPDFSSIPEEDLAGVDFENIRTSFQKITRVRSFTSLDEHFLNNLSRLLRGHKCIEVYAGNGWLSHELNKRSVEIEATDNYYYYEVLGRTREFIRKVRKISAHAATNRFTGELSESDKCYILISFPEGDRSELVGVFETASRHPNCSIIIIAIDEKAWKMQEWKSMQFFTRKDITSDLKYTPSPFKERAIIFSHVNISL